MTTRVTHVDSGRLQSLPLISTTLRSHIVDLTASHSLTQVYNNSSTRDISEALYTFPLYESSSVTDFQVLVGERTISGVVKQRAEAKAIYEAAKSVGKVTALFSQDTGEVFTTSIGNIPAGGLVVVVIKYVHELKQDIEVDGVKLVIPTVIAPKYGNGPATAGLVFGNRWRTCWENFSQGIQDIGDAEDAGISLSITATMSGPIRGVTSPSHPISIGLGSHSSADTDFNPAKAHATLALASRSLSGLDKDFSLLIKANSIGDPGAFLAPHPTLKDTSTLMVTIVPKFALPSQGHEIIFVVDRSGSMGNKIATVRSALQLFLSSLPAGLYFNICSFGFNHSSLWPQSQEYSEVSLNVAKTHAMGLDSNMGGTEILKAVVDAVKMRRQNMRTEILILTDGEVWNAESLFEFINESSKDGNVRFFSLGVGDTVSHSLVEGISRAGRGYSQIVNIASNLQRKVMRMLKAALTPHVNDWDIGWAGKPEEQRAILTAPAPRTVAPISLFNPNCDPDNTPFASYSSTPTLTLPKVIQAPAIPPGLFSFSRTTVYFLISNGDRPGKVFLKGSAHVTSSNTICPLQIEIPVHAITSTRASLGLYRLAGRKLLQDLEEGRLSYLEGIYDKAEEPTKHAELIAKEGTRVGLEFGLASKWTSFVAVAGVEATGEEQGDQQEEERTDVLAGGETQTTDSGFASSSSRRAVRGGESAGGGRGSHGGERTGAPREGESQAANSGSPGSPSRRTSHSKSALGSGRAAERVSASPILQAQDHTCQQQQLSRGGALGFGAPPKVPGGGIVRGAYFGGPPPPPPSPQTSTRSGGPSGRLVGGARTGGRPFGAAPKPSSKPVQAGQRRSSSEPIARGGESLGLITETAAPLASPVRKQNLSSPISSPSRVFSPSSLGHKPSSPLGTLPTSQAPAPASSRPAMARYSVTPTSCSPTSPHQARCTTQGSHPPASPSRGPAPRPRACCVARGSHPPASPPHSPAPRTQARYTAQGSRPMVSPSRDPARRPRACCAARGSHPPAFPSYSPAPRPQVCPTVQDSRSATPPPQVVCTPRDSRSATPPSHSPALPVYYIAQDPLGNFDLDSLTPGPEVNLQSSFLPAQHCQQQEPQWTPEGSHNLVSDLATLPQFNGMFKADGRILAWLGLQNSRLENAHTDADFLATVAVIVVLEEKFPELLEEWEFMVSKAKEAVRKLYPEGDREAVASAVRVALGV